MVVEGPVSYAAARGLPELQTHPAVRWEQQHESHDNILTLLLAPCQALSYCGI